ncbi:MAG: hypothetical protein AAF696_10205 [Bacteroidota bacterium]
MKKPQLFTLIKLFSLSLAAALIFPACVVDEGPIGPPGRDGRDGNAEVFSINYLAEESDWYDVGLPGDAGYYIALDLDVPEIDQDIVDNGVVLVYYRETPTNAWTALPYTFISHDPEYIEKLDMIYALEFVGIQSMASDRSAVPYTGTFRVIVAPGIGLGKSATGKMDISDYESVAKQLGITEDMQSFRSI